MQLESLSPTVKKLKLADVDFASYNPRTISDPAFQGLRESLGDLGLLEVPVVNTFGGKLRMISGHQRCKAMIEEGYTHADCIVVEFDDATERMANLTMNNPAIQGTFDPTKSLPSLESIRADLPKPDYMQFESLRTEVLQAVNKEKKSWVTAKDETPDPEKKTHSKLGKPYQRGDRSLLCDDVLTSKNLKKLLAKKAAACITDPPYNVAYQSRAGEKIENDDLKKGDWETFLRGVTDLILKGTTGACYVFMASKELPALESIWVQNGGVVSRWIFWVKDRFTVGYGNYHHQYEPIMFGWKQGATPHAPAHARTNVLEFPKPSVNALHPTQKPVDLIRVLMEDSTEEGDLVFEPFAGSGTTLVVAEELGRRCLACELAPQHADTTRRRWAEQVHGQGCDWRKLTPAC